MHQQRAATVHPMRLLGVFAHPDDEVFCMGGTLAQWAAAGGETMILSATRGEAGQIQDTHAASRGALGAVREQELRAASARLGVRRVACLDYGDGALAEVDDAKLAEHVATFIRDFQPDVVVTFGPDGGYGHPDHIAISRATTQACRLVAREDGEDGEDGWAPQLYYSAFPRQQASLCHRLAHWLTTRGAPFRGSAGFVRALALLADEAKLLGHTADTVEVQWFPADFAIVEQGERGNTLYLIISGHAALMHEDARGARHQRQRLGPGEFFGAEALALRSKQDASVVALDTVTCLVLSQQAPTAFAGRGEHASVGGGAMGALDGQDGEQAGLTRMDISAHLDHKVAALAAHRTQFAIEPEMLSLSPLWLLLSQEYFEPVPLATATGVQYATDADDTLWLGAQPLLAMLA
jgi:LmbE family N-acetylglucosaminyl deacetylase